MTGCVALRWLTLNNWPLMLVGSCIELIVKWKIFALESSAEKKSSFNHNCLFTFLFLFGLAFYLLWLKDLGYLFNFLSLSITLLQVCPFRYIDLYLIFVSSSYHLLLTVIEMWKDHFQSICFGVCDCNKSCLLDQFLTDNSCHVLKFIKL